MSFSENPRGLDLFTESQKFGPTLRAWAQARFISGPEIRMSGGDGTDGDGLMGEAERDTSWSWDRKKGKETTWRRSRRREDKEVYDKNE